MDVVFLAILTQRARSIRPSTVSHRLIVFDLLNPTLKLTTSVNLALIAEEVDVTYRQDASPEVDEAWEALGVNCKSPTREKRNVWADLSADRTAILPESLGPKSGLTKDHARRNANMAEATLSWWRVYIICIVW